jgi:predicted nucleotidyltransferase
MNSDKDMRSQDFDSGTNPQSPFTFIFGGNIISRGLTFHGLLSMYFSRDSKHKLDSGTYIQRARMFGNREKLFDDFELIIPEKLYFDWWTVFKEHRESLATINGFDSPLWFSSERTKTTQESSIDKANIISESGEMYWEKFKLTTEIEKVYEKGIESNRLDCVKDLFRLLGHKSFHKAFYDENINDPDSLKDKNILEMSHYNFVNQDKIIEEKSKNIQYNTINDITTKLVNRSGIDSEYLWSFL